MEKPQLSCRTLKPISGCSASRPGLTLARESGRGWRIARKAGDVRRTKCSTKSVLNMAYRVELIPRAGRDLRDIYWRIHADDSPQAFAWFNGLEAMIYSLD